MFVHAPARHPVAPAGPTAARRPVPARHQTDVHEARRTGRDLELFMLPSVSSPQPSVSSPQPSVSSPQPSCPHHSRRCPHQAGRGLGSPRKSPPCPLRIRAASRRSCPPPARAELTSSRPLATRARARCPTVIAPAVRGQCSGGSAQAADRRGLALAAAHRANPKFPPTLRGCRCSPRSQCFGQRGQCFGQRGQCFGQRGQCFGQREQMPTRRQGRCTSAQVDANISSSDEERPANGSGPGSTPGRNGLRPGCLRRVRQPHHRGHCPPSTDLAR